MYQSRYLSIQQLNPKVIQPSQNQQVVLQFQQQSYTQKAISYPQVQGKLTNYQLITQMPPQGQKIEYQPVIQ